MISVTEAFRSAFNTRISIGGNKATIGNGMMTMKGILIEYDTVKQLDNRFVELINGNRVAAAIDVNAVKMIEKRYVVEIYNSNDIRDGFLSIIIMDRKQKGKYVCTMSSDTAKYFAKKSDAETAIRKAKKEMTKGSTFKIKKVEVCI